MNPDFLASAGQVGPLGALPLSEGFGSEAELLGGDYLLLERVGEGGMGEVYRAIQLSTRREVAVKRMRAGRSDARFEQEVAALARLRHPGIAALIQAGVHQGRPYLVMELVRGNSLAERLASGPLPPKEAVRIVREAAEAIEHAHRSGIVHRDLKPGNLLLDADGTVRVTDFSIAKDLGTGGAVTLDGQTLGTPAYMAPEQIDSRRGTVGPATDVYGLGATLYHALTGQAPFSGATDAETLRQAATREPDWGAAWKGIHHDLRTLCQRAMHPDPARRFASAGEFATDLGRFLEGLPVQARPVTRAERLARWVWRPWPLATVAALLLGIAGAVTLTGWLQRTRVEGLLRDWPKTTPEAIRVLALGRGSTKGLRASFNEDGRVFAWGASDGHVRLAHVETARALANGLRRTAPVRYHCFLPGTARTNLFVAADDGLWRVWTAGAHRRVLAEGTAQGGVVGFDATEDGKRFVVGARSGDVTGWSLEAGLGRGVFSNRIEGGLIGLHLAAESDRLLTVGHWGALDCWDLRSDKLMWGRRIPDVPTATAMTRDRDLLAVATVVHPSPKRLHGWIRFIQEADGSETGAVPISGSVHSLVFSPDGTRLLILGNQDKMRVWDARGRPVCEMTGHGFKMAGGEFSPDGLRLLTWDEGGNARLWDAHTGQPLTGFWSGAGGIAHATFAPDGWRIGSGDIGASGTLWDAACPLPTGWDRVALTKALVRNGGLEALRRAAWLNPSDGGILRQLAEATRRQSKDEWREKEAAFFERRAAAMDRR